MYVSTKRYGHEAGFSMCYRQHLADSHCRFLHGYSLAFEFEFQSPILDVRNWVCDFGGFKTLKAFLEDYFDHTLLVAHDDPAKGHIIRQLTNGDDGEPLAQVREIHKTGCEGIAEFLFWYMNEVWLLENGYGEASQVFCRSVRVFETPNNSAMYESTPESWPIEKEALEEAYQ